MARLRRTVLFVPANSGKMIGKASALGADMVILDCEDSVPQQEKGNARATFGPEMRKYDWGRKEVGVRVNGLDTPFFDEDLKAAVEAGAKFVVLPKIESASEIVQIQGKIEKFGRGNRLPEIMVTIENPKGLNNVEQILAASPLITSMEFGSEDFALSLGIYGVERSGQSTLYARSRIVASGHAAGVDVLDQAFVGLADPEGLRASALDARNLGFTGKAVIHPSQIDVVNSVFTPSKEEVGWAKRVLEAWKSAQAEGRGAFRLDDKMVDVVHVKMAESIVSKAESLGL
ncbi:MAG: CoA ester lyase [Nitrososphaerota archaeon]|nr:CoA ester lyase [Nitrososphaerota archaeon]